MRPVLVSAMGAALLLTTGPVWADPIRVEVNGQRVHGNRREPYSREGAYGASSPQRREPAGRPEELGSPDVTALFPRQGTLAADPRTEIFARFRPGARIDYNSVRLYLNGRDSCPSWLFRIRPASVGRLRLAGAAGAATGSRSDADL